MRTIRTFSSAMVICTALVLSAVSAFAGSPSTSAADRYHQSVVRLCKAIGGQYDSACEVAYMPDKSCQYLGGTWSPTQGCLFPRHVTGTPNPSLH